MAEDKNMFGRILDAVANRKTAAPTHARSTVSNMLFPDGSWGPSSNQSRGSDAAEDNIVVNRAVSIIASTLASVPICLYRGETKVTSGPLYDLLASPNSLEAWPRFCRSITQMALVDGQSFAVLGERRPSTQVPVDMLPTAATEIDPLRPEGEPYNLTGWEVEGLGRVEPEQVVRFEYMPDPSDPLGAISPLAAADSDIEADELAASYNRNALESGGAVSGVLSWTNPDVRLAEEDLDRASRIFEEKYSGQKNANSTAVLTGDWSYDQLGGSSRDLEYIQGRQFIQSRLALIYGIPPVLLGDYSTSGLSSAGLTIARRFLYEQAIIPFARNVQTALTKALCTQPNETIQFDFESIEALREDYTEKLSQAKELAAIGYPINVLNEELNLGMPAMSWGDDALVNAGLTTAASLTAVSEVEEETADDSEGGVMLDDAQQLLAISIIEKVQSGALPRDSAKAMLTEMLGLDERQAEMFLGSAGLESNEPEPVVDFQPDAEDEPSGNDDEDESDEEVRSTPANFTSTPTSESETALIRRMRLLK